MPCLDERRGEYAGHQEIARQVGGDHGHEVLRRHLEERPRVVEEARVHRAHADPGVVHHHVQIPPSGQKRLSGGIDRGRVAHVERHRLRGQPPLGPSRHRFVESGAGAGGRAHRRPSLEQRVGHRRTETAGGTGDHRPQPAQVRRFAHLTLRCCSNQSRVRRHASVAEALS